MLINLFVEKVMTDGVPAVKGNCIDSLVAEILSWFLLMAVF